MLNYLGFSELYLYLYTGGEGCCGASVSAIRQVKYSGWTGGVTDRGSPHRPPDHRSPTLLCRSLVHSSGTGEERDISVYRDCDTPAEQDVCPENGSGSPAPLLPDSNQGLYPFLS